ncbi:hypothetical protein C1645_840662 [Glomus cerebriforme]|uniref:Uncharacterized protein n=1 Tax=Glomus cerebriforme TaxID=658196 RepID=A0A397S0J6_9GLOM|nr:hypothetical protein C1645_840662 [Glomus cerebriforme]
MKECGYRKILIDDSSTVKVETINGNRYSIFTDEGEDNNDMNESSFEEFDDNYKYNFNNDYNDKEEEKTNLKDNHNNTNEEQESEEEKEGEEGDSKEEEEGNNEEENPLISKNIIEMGNCLHNLLRNIYKVPTPPPTNNNNIVSKHRYKEKKLK